MIKGVNPTNWRCCQLQLHSLEEEEDAECTYWRILSNNWLTKKDEKCCKDISFDLWGGLMKKLRATLIYQSVFFSERPYIPKCFFLWETLTGAALPICVMLYFLKINYFLSENSEPFACILCLQLQDMLDLLGCLLCFLSYFRMIDLSCRLPHLSGPASKELVWQLFFQPFVNDRKWQPWLYQFLSHL